MATPLPTRNAGERGSTVDSADPFFDSLSERRAVDDAQDTGWDTSPGPSSSPSRLYRSKKERVLGGVCGGIAQYFGVDPVLPRLAFVLLTLGVGSGVLLYIIAWVVIPEATAEEDLASAPRSVPVSARLIFGGMLVIAGAVMLVNRTLPWFDLRLLGPALLIALGVAIALQGRKR